MTTQSPFNSDNAGPMFLGEYPRGVDKKGRVTLPAPFREALQDEQAVITRGLDQCLLLFPKSQFDQLRQKVNQMGISDPRIRRFRRHFFAGAMDVKPDGMGRINIPQYLRDYAGLTGDVIVAGNDSYIEIWDAERWEQEQDILYEDEGLDAQNWKDLGI
jgi:MraZ protein